MAQSKQQSLPERIDNVLASSFALVHRILIAAVAIALVILSLMALWDTIVLVQDEIVKHDLTRAITIGVDTVFLVVILLELLHTVINRGPLAEQAPEFIVIGITSGIRHGLSLVATSAGGETVDRVIKGKVYHITVPGSNARDTVINLGINSVSVLFLVLALWLVRFRFRSTSAEETDLEGEKED